MSCPVRRECLDWALENREQFGVLGGMTEEERWPLIRVVPQGPGGGMDRCVEARDRILLWRRKGIPLRQIAARLGVDRAVVRKALARFDCEDAQQDAEVAA